MSNKLIQVLILGLLILGVTVAITACEKKDHNPSPPKSTHALLSNLPTKEEMELSLPLDIETFDVQKKMTEKEYIRPNVSFLLVDKNWQHYICFNGEYILSNRFTDVSALPNCFFEKDNRKNSLNELYELNTKSKSISCPSFNIGNYADGKLTITGTSVKNDITKNLFLEKIELSASVNTFEGGLESIRKVRPTAANTIGIGSTENDITSTLGETAISTYNKIGGEMRVYTYSSDKVDLKFELEKERNKSNSAFVVTRITWSMKQVSDRLEKTKD